MRDFHPFCPRFKFCVCVVSVVRALEIEPSVQAVCVGLHTV
jgi:hypothetical protein